MSAVLEAREPSARYLDAVQPALALQFELLATAPSGVARLRELILALAIRGRLIPRNSNEEIRVTGATVDDDGPFELPESWLWMKLGSLQPEFQNGASSRGDAGGQPITVLRLADIKDRRVSLSNTREVPIRRQDIAKYRLQDGDILITRVNGSADIIGQFNLVEGELQAIYCDHFIRMRVSRDVLDPEYLALFGGSEVIRSRISNLFISTAGQKTVNQGHIGSLPIAIPPLAEQGRIVARVDELMRLCDALEAQGRLEAQQHARLLGTLLGTLTDSTTPEELAANWQRVAAHFDLLLDRPEAVDALEQTILQLAVRGLLVPQDPNDEPASALVQKVRLALETSDASGGARRGRSSPSRATSDELFAIPAEWMWTVFPDLCSITGGSTPSKAVESNWVGNIPWVSPKDMKVSEIGDAQDHVSPAAVAGSLSLIPTGSLLMVVRGMILAHSFPVAVTRVPVTINQDMKALTPFVPELLPFLRLLCEGLKGEILGLVERSTHGTCKLESPKIFGLPIPLPPLPEQARIVARVTELRRLCADLRQRLTASQTTQSHLAEALVDSAIA